MHTRPIPNNIATANIHTEKISYSYYEDGKEHQLDFNLSDLGMIDSFRYSLLDVLHSKRLDHLSFDDRIEIMNSFISNTKAVDHYTYRRELQNKCDSEVNVGYGFKNETQKMINLASNDYLNLSIHPRIKKAAADCAIQSGLGSGSAPMLAGTYNIHAKLEKKMAAFLHCESAMLFTSGYGANIGVLKALLRDSDVAICDIYAHASLIDGFAHTNQLFFCTQ